ncbi:MAG: HemK2/MTQ2 family protein methyltransferase [Candidatus Methylomirabilis sp.]
MDEDLGTHLFLYQGLTLRIDDGVQVPKGGTLLLARQVPALARGGVLDLGTGCGLLALLAARGAARVVATDVVETCVRCAWRNVLLNGFELKVDVRLGDLFAPVAGETFDVILTNPPQMPTPQDREADGDGAAADDGGPDGWAILDRVIREAPTYLKPGGQLVFTLFDFLGEQNGFSRLKEVGLSPAVIARETHPFPRLGRERMEHIRSVVAEGTLPPTGIPAICERLVICGRKA